MMEKDSSGGGDKYDKLKRASKKSTAFGAGANARGSKRKGKKHRKKSANPNAQTRLQQRRGSVGQRLEAFKANMQMAEAVAVDEARRSREENGYDPRRESRERARQTWHRAMGKVRAMHAFSQQKPSMRRSSNRRRRQDDGDADDLEFD